MVAPLLPSTDSIIMVNPAVWFFSAAAATLFGSFLLFYLMGREKFPGFFGDPDCHCVSPMEDDICQRGTQLYCESALCYNANVQCDSLTFEKKLFFDLCLGIVGLMELTNCRQSLLPGILPNPRQSDRPGAQRCFGDQGIHVINRPRDDCDASSCCRATNLCPIEDIMHFMLLAYGIETDDDSCETSLDYYGGDAADCDFISEGDNNDVLVCRNATVLPDRNDPDYNYCHVAFVGTNDMNDFVLQMQHYMLPLSGRTVRFENNGQVYEYYVIRGHDEIAYGFDPSAERGMVRRAYKSLESKGCLSQNKAAIHLTGHSLGSALANMLAVQISALHPEVYLKMTVAGEPATLIEPLQGAVANLPVWDRKTTYFTGQVFPRSDVMDGVGVMEYGMYQSYDWIPQLMPNGHHFWSSQTKLWFMCEVVDENQRVKYFLDERGCAVGRDDVINPKPDFPHRGGLQTDQRRPMAGVIASLLSILDPDERMTDLRIMLNMLLVAEDLRFVESFFLFVDLHVMRRYLMFFNKLTENGGNCDAMSFTNSNPMPATCPTQ